MPHDMWNAEPNDARWRSRVSGLVARDWSGAAVDAPVASFTYSPTSGIETGQLVTYDGTSSTGEIDTYEWDDAASLSNPVARGTWPMNVNSGPIGEMAYQNPGTKYPRLWVSGPGGTDSAIQTLSVASATSPPPSSGSINHGNQLTQAMTGFAGNGYNPANLGSNEGVYYSTHNGQVIEGRVFDRTGTGSVCALNIQHQNVVVRNCQINHRQGSNGIRTTGGGSAIIEYCEINGQYRTSPTTNNGSIGITGNNIVARRNNFRGGRDGMHPGSNCHIYENFIIDLHHNGQAHNDSIVMSGTTSGPRNTLIELNNCLAGNSGGIDCYSFGGPIRNVDIFKNHIRGQGMGWGCYGGFVGASTGSGNPDEPQTSYACYIENIKIEDNTFVGPFGWPASVGEGSNAGVNISMPGCTFLRNKWFNGNPHNNNLAPRCGVRSNACETFC